LGSKPLSEGEAISLIRQMIGAPGPGVEIGAGDDAALFHFASDSVILTVDSMFEGIHFKLDTSGLADVGWKAMAASISDVAAMGGQPACALVSVGLGSPPTEDEIRALMGGALEAAASCNCAVIGGDLCRTGCGLGISVTVAGIPHPSGPVLRSGARQGDVIGVTGHLGDSAGGLHVLASGNDELRAKFAGLVEAHLRPRPRVLAGEIIAASGATSMEDISDGLALDLLHICRESGVGCEVFAESVPLSGELMTLSQEACADPLGWALGGGEDFELVFTLPPGCFEGAAAALAGHGVPVAKIGSITLASAGTKLIARDGRRTDLEGLGYDHFL